jgi:hypothetical protein
MITLEKFEDFVLLMNNRGNVTINLEKMNSEDYLKSIEFIYRLKGAFERIGRFKFSIFYR